MAKATVTNIGLQTGTDSTVYATWTWTKSNTDYYRAIWYYTTGDGVRFVGSDEQVTVKQSTYTAPDNAKKVVFKVKPVSKKHTVNEKKVSYWTADWSTEKKYTFSTAPDPPDTPSVPTVSVSKYKLTARLTDISGTADKIQFQVIKNDSSKFTTGTASVSKSLASASFSCTIAAGYRYKVRARGYNTSMKEYGDWSDYSDNVSTIPDAPYEITSCKATSETSIYLKWDKADGAETYEVMYATQKSYLSGSDAATTVTGITGTSYTLTGLDSGYKYYFKVRAANAQGESAYTSIVSCVLGTTPSAPTTWSDKTTAMAGDVVTLHWVHNSEDNSEMTGAQLVLNFDDGTKETLTLTDTYYELNTSLYAAEEILWKVRTKGILNSYSSYSTQRSITIYEPPTLEMHLTDADGNEIEELTTFPLCIQGIPGPDSQSPVGYHLAIISNDSYSTTDGTGSTVVITEGSEVYSEYFDMDDAEFLVELSAGDIDLENNIVYTATLTVTMDSGLTVSASITFTVAWPSTANHVYDIGAEIGYDTDTYCTYIHPYYREAVFSGSSAEWTEEDADYTYVSGVTLSVYRREFDGSLTELITGAENEEGLYLVDAHPSLDYARYRVVAIATDTGAVDYYDVPGYPIGEESIIINWDEDWSQFDPNGEENELEDPPYSGSILKLPYNIKISDSHEPDVELAEYIGREHPVSYYGTQKGMSSTWTADILKSDTDTLYAVRRLAAYMGDVYVREPSGSGYWASIAVTFEQEYSSSIVPITFEVKKVEGED